MKSKFKIVILSLLFLLSASFVENKEDENYLNFIYAYENRGTFQYFLVAKIKNINTGEIQEICTKGSAFRSALFLEFKPKNSKHHVSENDSIVKNNTERYYEFKNKKAISQLWIRYSMYELAELEKEINFDSLAVKIRQQKDWRIENLNDKLMTMYAHALFNRGILTGENECRGGALHYIDRKNNPYR